MRNNAMSLHYGTYHLPIVGVVSAGVPESPSVEVWQSGHGAMEVVLMHTGYQSGSHCLSSVLHTHTFKCNDKLALLWGEAQ